MPTYLSNILTAICNCTSFTTEVMQDKVSYSKFLEPTSLLVQDKPRLYILFKKFYGLTNLPFVKKQKILHMKFNMLTIHTHTHIQACIHT